MHAIRRAAAIAAVVTLTLPAAAGDSGPLPRLRVLGTHDSGLFNVGGAEIPTYDPLTRRAFVVNAGSATVDVLDLRVPHRPQKVASLDVVADLAPRSVGSANSVDTRFGLLAVLPAGALPDMVTFSESGRYILAANEGEPDTNYTNDPVGSVTIVDLLRLGGPDFVRQVHFDAFNAGGRRAGELPATVRIYGPGASVAQDLEPEYIVTDRGSAYVTLQENNAIAVIDLRSAEVREIRALGFKDHSLPANKLDASDRDNAINIANWPVSGMYQPDAIEYFDLRSKGYYITANEGDARDYAAFAEEARVSALTLDATAFPTASTLRNNANLGRLTVTRALGNPDGDGDHDQLFVLGGRSFSIWNAATGALVFDSGAEIEQTLANLLPLEFNSNHESNGSIDNRSDNKGPEVEGVTVGWVRGRPYAFIGLERIGGVMVYDLSDPAAPSFVDYLNNRNFRDAAGAPIATCAEFDPPASTDIADCLRPNPAAGDLGPEGLKFVPALLSPTFKPLLIVGNEVSGTTTVYEFR